MAADQGRLDEAAKRLTEAADSGNQDYASLANYALAQLYVTQGKPAEAEKLLRALIAKPTIIVSKEAGHHRAGQADRAYQAGRGAQAAGAAAHSQAAVGRAAITALGSLTASEVAPGRMNPAWQRSGSRRNGAAGRRYPEPPHPYRNEFQRDRDRIVHARAFRRLEDKTQVFTPALSDHFRNRLTHTIEVAQIARTAGRGAGPERGPDRSPGPGARHRPPALRARRRGGTDRQMRRFGERFDHNLHALRIVERFEQRYARFPGLNLTFEVREGIVKHSRDFEPGEIPELDEYLPGPAPAAGGAVDRSGRRDRLQHGRSRRRLLGRHVHAWRTSRPRARLRGDSPSVEMQFPAAPERVRFQEALRRLIDLLVSGLIEGPTGRPWRPA